MSEMHHTAAGLATPEIIHLRPAAAADLQIMVEADGIIGINPEHRPADDPTNAPAAQFPKEVTDQAAEDMIPPVCLGHLVCLPGGEEVEAPQLGLIKMPTAGLLAGLGRGHPPFLDSIHAA